MIKDEQRLAYNARFTQALIGGVRQSIARIQQADGIPAERDRAQAWQVLEFALERAELWEECKPLILLLTPKMEQAGLRADWLPYLRHSIKTSHACSDDQAEAELLTHAGWFHGQLGQLEEACQDLERAVALYRTLNEPDALGTALNRLALIERRRRHPQVARNLAEEALTCLSAASAERANCYVVLGELAMDRRDWPRSEEHARCAYQIWSAAGDRRRAAWALRNLSPALFEQGKHEEAMQVLQEAVHILEAERDPVQLAVTRMNLGNVHRLTDNRRAAIDLFNQAEMTFRSTGDEIGLAMLYYNRGCAYRHLKEWRAAEHDLKASIALWTKLDNLRSRLNAIDELALMYHAQGDDIRAAELAGQGLNLAQTAPPSRRQELEHVAELLTRHLTQFSPAGRTG